MASQSPAPASPGKQQIFISEGMVHVPTSPGDKPHLIGSKCSNCGTVAFPKKSVCPACVRDDTMKEVPLSRVGKVNSYTVSYVSVPGLKAPYLIAYVDLPEVSRIFTIVTGCEPDEKSLRIGMEMETVIEKIREDDKGNELVGYKFQPVRK